MQIRSNNGIFSPINSIFANASCGIGTAKKKGPQPEMTESYARGVEQMEGASGSNSRLKRIMDKARSGKKLSPEEMDFLAKESPENYQKIKQAMMQREMLKEQLSAAKTKEEAERLYSQTIATALKTGDEIAVAQLSDEHSQFLAKHEEKNPPLQTFAKALAPQTVNSEKAFIETLLTFDNSKGKNKKRPDDEPLMPSLDAKAAEEAEKKRKKLHSTPGHAALIGASLDIRQ